MTRGRLIVLEGLDGCGKSTAARMLADHLGALTSTTPCARIRRVRVDFDEAFNASPVARSVAYGASVLAVGEELAGRRESGRDVVVDRYLLSTLVYAPDEARSVLEPLAALVPPADLTVFLDAPLAARSRRLDGREGCTAHDLGTLDDATDRALRSRYQALADHPAAGRFATIDASGTPADTLDQILAVVTSAAP